MAKQLIQIKNLSKSFGAYSLFNNISLSINEGDIFALVGENGSGKTTLLKVILGQEVLDQGTLNRSENLEIGYLPQNIVIKNPLLTIKEYLEEGPLLELERQLNAYLKKGDIQAWEKVHEKYEQLGGYHRIPIEKIFKGLKLDLLILDQKMSSLSEGQKIRVVLAKALSESPNLLLLDEPTNHLDREMVEWLEDTLQARSGATLIVSHDRAFLNATCNRLIEIKRGKLNSYEGNYDFYLKEQKRILEKKIKEYEDQQEEKARLKQQIKSTTFSKRNPPSCSDRNKMAYDRRGEKHQKSIQRNLNDLKARLEEIETNQLIHPKPKSIKGLRFDSKVLRSSVAIELERVSKSYGDKVILSKLTKTLSKGDRVVLTGRNGAGKTTLLKILAGIIQVDEGQVKYAPTAKIAYLDQEVDQLPKDQSSLTYFEEQFGLSEEELRSELHKAALGEGHLLNASFSSLSLGQRKRMVILALMLQKPNVLLLDEPTNHLDLLTLEALETSLLHFQGLIVAVSHDITFIKKIATQIWDLDKAQTE